MILGYGFSTVDQTTKKAEVAKPKVATSEIKQIQKPINIGLPSGKNTDKGSIELATEIITRHEGLHLKAYWDFKGWSIGYGTRSYKGEVITQQEARERMKIIVRQLDEKVRKDFTGLQDHQYAALISLKYNCHSGYRNLVRKGITEARFRGCNSAGGKVLRGLVNRRANERALYTKGVIY